MNRLRSPWSAQSLVSARRTLDGASARSSILPSFHATPSENMRGDAFTSSNASSHGGEHEPVARPFLALHHLRKLSEQCVLDAGEPVALQCCAGLIAVGCAQGPTYVFDLAQRLRCVCSAPSVCGLQHRVTALALSEDGRTLGVGHASGHILLYDAQAQGASIRHVAPVSMAQIGAGTCEGHLEGAAITHLHFVGRRKTAIVSADAHGLCFFHSLGKMLGMASNDTLRVYGRYPPHASDALCDVATLPVGMVEHVADQHKFVALLLPQKLLLLGLQPSARTWCRSYASRRGKHCALAWFPATRDTETHHPKLAFAFGRELRVLHLKAAHVKPRNKHDPSPTAVVLSEEALANAPAPIVRMQWVHRTLLMLVTPDTWLLYDFRLGAYTEWQPHDPLVVHARDTAAWETRLRVWHSKLFILAHGRAFVGDFVPWDARLTQLADAHDDLGAIQLALHLYHGHGVGSAIGLPDDAAARQHTIANRIELLEEAAARNLFSARSVPDEVRAALARLCATAAVATGRFDFLFGKLYDIYDEHGVENVFVHEMEQFILQGEMPTPAPRVMQRLLDDCARHGETARINALLLRVDPLHLDLDQALSLSLKHRLWEAYIYLCTAALRDYTTPLEALLRSVYSYLEGNTLVGDIYQLFHLLASVGAGVQYPGDDPIDDAALAIDAVYTLLLSPTLHTSLMSTVDSVYPYLSMVLQLDAEAFMDAMDLTFESGLLAEHAGTRIPTRQHIWDVLYTLGASDMCSEFIALFLAHNAAKYPQFIHFATHQMAFLFAVLTRPHCTTPESDREFALECLFSAHAFTFEKEQLDTLYAARLWRVYEYGLRKANDFCALFAFYLANIDDAQHSPGQLYARVAAMFALQGMKSAAAQQRLVPVLFAEKENVPDALLGDLARVVIRFFPDAQKDMVAALAAEPMRQYLFLVPYFPLDAKRAHTSTKAMRRAWIERSIEFCPCRVIAFLDAYPPDFFELEHVLRTAQTHNTFDVIVYVHARMGDESAAMAVVDAQAALHAAALLDAIDKGQDRLEDSSAERVMHSGRETTHDLQILFRVAVRIALERSTGSMADRAEACELWYRVLHALMQFLHTLLQPSGNGVHILHALGPGPLLAHALHAGHEMTQEALGVMLASVPSETVSFPDLFSRLASQQSVSYSEIRIVLDGMLSAYRLRCEVLSLGARLNEADAVRLFHALAKERGLGWLFPKHIHLCAACNQHASQPSPTAPRDLPPLLTLSRTGQLYHAACLHTSVA
ncbi:hypothetical protein MVES1_003560 [Malassezia vespertilionis]|uniref:uncharacterized protein n=1 Tax=Malassezia vespertilionis TaxID=2020962 RepID=UPI0024B05FC6|nr:uncharacterized protein MVES1_003560 [Malassezia vespertilionis]WFD08189.1 hypothetical protein MVES1_003560 [Malassezia vespertilionis]